MEVRRYLMLKEEYLPLVLSGRKRITIRRRTRLREGDLFYIHSGGKVWGIGRVVRIERVMKDDITPEHARLEGMSYEKLRKELDRIYGKRNVPLYVVHFEVVEKFKEPVEVERRFYGDLSPPEIARLALRHGLFHGDTEAEQILRRIAETGSIRKVAIELGGLRRRGKVRAILRKAYEELRERGIV